VYGRVHCSSCGDRGLNRRLGSRAISVEAISLSHLDFCADIALEFLHEISDLLDGA
jgi:hypothetical protein